jgi:hypothetical protein
MVQKRSKNLGDAEVRQIVEILDGWSGKLGWELLIDAIELRMFNRYTRQALYKHERIRHAFDLRKKDISGNDGDVRRVESPQLQIALDRIARLEAENSRLESENNKLLEQYARWAYNAYTRGLDHDFLNRALPPVNRGQTRN